MILEEKKGLLSLMGALVALPGLIGCLVVSDEFDAERLFLLAFFALPLTCVVLFLLWQYPEVLRFLLPMVRALVIAMAIVFLWGHLLLWNALTGSHQNVALQRVFKEDHQDRALAVTYRQGGLGLIYRWR